MRRLLAHRFGHYLFLLAVAGAVLLPNLGATTLWDDDEGVNAECAREMAEAGTWVVPTFNWDLRTAKPVFLYWLMRLSYLFFGVSEWSARLPSVLMTLATALLVYELARRMFDSATGVLAAVVTVTSIEVCKLGHAATPDATLLFFTVLYFYLLHFGTANGGRWWFVPCGIASGLAMLTKGPVGLILPGAVVVAWFAWNRELWRLFDRRMLWGGLAWGLVAIPWFAMIAAETKGEWPRTFFLRENLGRTAEPMENHRGPVVYYLVVVCLFFAPWSAFLYATLRDAIRFVPLPPGGGGVRGGGGGETHDPLPPNPPPARGGGNQRYTSPTGEGGKAYRLLLVWIGVYFLAFSAAATKLPHYIAPAYPPLAILTARFLVRWMRGEAEPPKWVLPAAAVGVGVTGLTVGVGLLIGGGAIPFPIPSEKMRVFPGLAQWAWIGAFPTLGAALMWTLRRNRPAVVLSLTASTVVFIGCLAAFPLLVLDRFKAAKELVAASGARQLDREARVASLEYSQPSLTFYCGRKVDRLNLPLGLPTDERARNAVGMAAGFLEQPFPAFLFVPEPMWREIEPWVRGGVRGPLTEVARRYDFTRNAVILVITNR